MEYKDIDQVEIKDIIGKTLIYYVPIQDEIRGAGLEHKGGPLEKLGRRR